MPRLSHHHLRPIKGSIPYETMKQICEKYLKNTNEIKAWQEGLLSQVWVDWSPRLDKKIVCIYTHTHTHTASHVAWTQMSTCQGPNTECNTAFGYWKMLCYSLSLGFNKLRDSDNKTTHAQTLPSKQEQSEQGNLKEANTLWHWHDFFFNQFSFCVTQSLIFLAWILHQETFFEK